MGTIYRGDDLDDRQRRALDAWLVWHGLRYWVPEDGTVELHGAWAVVECLKLKRGDERKRGRGFDRRIFELGPDGLPDDMLRHTVRVRIRRPLSDWWPSTDREPVNHHPITAEQRAALVSALAAMPAIAAGMGGAFRAAAEAAHSMAEAIRRANAATRDDFGLLPAPNLSGPIRLRDVDTGEELGTFEPSPDMDLGRVLFHEVPAPEGLLRVVRTTYTPNGRILDVRRPGNAPGYRATVAANDEVEWLPLGHLSTDGTLTEPNDFELDPAVWNAGHPPLGIRPETDKLRDALAAHHKRREADNDEKGTHHE